VHEWSILIGGDWDRGTSAVAIGVAEVDCNVNCSILGQVQNSDLPFVVPSVRSSFPAGFLWHTLPTATLQSKAWCWHADSGATVHNDTWLSGCELETGDDLFLPAEVKVILDCEKGTVDISRNGSLLGTTHMFEGLKGKTLHLACGTNASSCSVEILTYQYFFENCKTGMGYHDDYISGSDDGDGNSSDDYRGNYRRDEYYQRHMDSMF
jgi:hypothetical protein